MTITLAEDQKTEFNQIKIDEIFNKHFENIVKTPKIPEFFGIQSFFGAIVLL